MLGVLLREFMFFISIGVSFLLFLGYTFTSIIMIPCLPVQSSRTKFSGGLFFLICGVIYLHAALHALTHHSLYLPRIATPLILFLYTVQLISATVFIFGFRREFKDLRNIVRLNQEVDEIIEEVEVLRREARERKS